MTISVELLDDKENVIRKEDLPYVPRIGEYISIQIDGMFIYYNVVEVWIRKSEGELAQACVRVEIDD